MTTTNYSEYRHRHIELGKCLSRIINDEEGEAVVKDQLIVNEILQRFSGLF